ncbi:ATP-dependent RNA helicase DHX33 [Brachionus plicatilis]|uniref:RNA helicase n=1 Tax=Brachionus plicatilis TaxID=10195 RepID=A0A3M7QKP0_BRAPC|nr:ATP-dependent RNA helicase DHX33 [Brachionus plicatilis]
MNLEKFRQSLPIYSIRHRLIAEINKNPTLILLGETGSGKTTQIPQYIYGSHSHMKGMIACTQPRRVAAITVAQRVSQEMNSELGKTTGYCVRFEDCTSPETKIKYMTDGMLLREAISDPLLLRYSVIILDEVHERTVHTDVLLGIVKSAQQKRSTNKKFHKPLKVILMSATMDVDEFSAYFNKAPVVYLEGRQFEVDVFHSVQEQTDYIFSSIATIFQIHKTAPVNEDILVFMTGQEEIESTVKTISELNKSNGKLSPMLVLPLYAALPSAKQLKVFEKAPSGCRKVIISTNIAETSITIKGIKYVIDSGMIKGKLYTPQNNLELLKVHKISKSQAWQRTGRAGRESSGICYRLFTESEFESMTLNTVPEILRSNLLSVALQLTALGIDDLINFDFISKPSVEALTTALNDLELLGAVKKFFKDNNGTENPEPVSKKRMISFRYELTEMGRKMAHFPLDPKFSRCILSADKLGCVEEVLKIVSVLSVDSVFHAQTNTSNKRDQAEAARQKFSSADGDHITLLNVYKAFMANKSSSKEWCQENFLDLKNLKLAVDINKQLKDICTKNSIKLTSSSNDSVKIRMALISGFFMNAAEYQKENEYKTMTSRQTVLIHPSSVLFNSKPACVLFNEIVKTNKTYMRDVSVISSNWLMETNPTYFKSKIKNLNDYSLSNLNSNIR